MSTKNRRVDDKDAFSKRAKREMVWANMVMGGMVDWLLRLRELDALASPTPASIAEKEKLTRDLSEFLFRIREPLFVCWFKSQNSSGGKRHLRELEVAALPEPELDRSGGGQEVPAKQVDEKQWPAVYEEPQA
jgi:hypothetical protein